MGAIADALVNAGLKQAQALIIEKGLGANGARPSVAEFQEALVRAGVDHHSASILASTILSSVPGDGNSVFGPYATTAELQAAYPAAANAGASALVGASAPYARYASNGAAWVESGGAADPGALAAYFPPGDNAGNRANIYKTLRLDVRHDGGVSNPKLEFLMANAYWRMGGDNANGIPGTDFVPTVLVSNIGHASDCVYYSFQGTQGDYPNSLDGTLVRFGFGVTPPNVSYRLQTAGGTTGQYPEVGGFSSLVRAGQTGHAFAARSSSGTERWWVAADGSMSANIGGTNGGPTLRGNAITERPLHMTKSDGSAAYGYQHSGNSMQWRYLTSAVTYWQYETTGAVRHVSTLLGFYGAPAISRPTVTGSRASGAALADLITKLASLGLIVDGTSA